MSNTTFSTYTISPKGRTRYGNYSAAGNITRMVSTTIFNGDNSTNSITPSNTGNTDEITSYNWLVWMSKTYNTFDRDEENTDDVQVIGFFKQKRAETYIGDLSSSAASENYGIIGIPESGMSISVENNGTTGCTIHITVDDTLSESAGTLTIPIYLDLMNDFTVGTTHADWYDEVNSTIYVQQNYSWKVSAAQGPKGDKGDSGQSAYRLSLSNSNASINCDSKGNILAGAIRPSCTGKVYLGSSPQSTVYYQISTTASGITSATTDGVLTIATSASTFNFTGLTTEISVSAFTSDNTLVDTGTMTICKSIAGESGQSAVSYWIEPSATEVIMDGTTIIPTAITFNAYRQVGGQDKTTYGDYRNKYYSYVYRNTGSETEKRQYPSSGGIAITASDINTYDRMRIYLHSNKYSAATIVYDFQDIAFLKNGTKGDKGDAGRTGAAIRGPVEWTASLRRWCNGSANTTYTEDEKWIDVVLVSGITYKCITSYNGSTSDTWDAVKGNWQSGTTFDFVSTKLLLATNASIDFLTGNEIYLKNNNGTITGGARGSNTANTINFWAGAEDPVNGLFKVRNDGTVEASKGTFGCTTIGSDTEFGNSLLASGTSVAAGNYYNNISSKGIKMYNTDPGSYNEIDMTISPVYPALTDRNAPIDIDTHSLITNTPKPALFTDGKLTARAFWGQFNGKYLEIDDEGFNAYYGDYGMKMNRSGITISTDGSYYAPVNPVYYSAYVVAATSASSTGTILTPSKEYRRESGQTINIIQYGTSASTSGYFRLYFGKNSNNFSGVHIQCESSGNSNIYFTQYYRLGASIYVYFRLATNTSYCYVKNFSITVLDDGL